MTDAEFGRWARVILADCLDRHGLAYMVAERLREVDASTPPQVRGWLVDTAVTELVSHAETCRRRPCEASRRIRTP